MPPRMHHRRAVGAPWLRLLHIRDWSKGLRTKPIAPRGGRPWRRRGGQLLFALSCAAAIPATASRDWTTPGASRCWWRDVRARWCRSSAPEGSPRRRANCRGGSQLRRPAASSRFVTLLLSPYQRRRGRRPRRPRREATGRAPIERDARLGDLAFEVVNRGLDDRRRASDVAEARHRSQIWDRRGRARSPSDATPLWSTCSNLTRAPG